VINLVVEPRKKYLFAVVVTVALVTAILVYLCPRDHWEYLIAITFLAILLGMLVVLSILPSIFVASAKLRATEQLMVRPPLDSLVKFVKGKYLGGCVN